MDTVFSPCGLGATILDSASDPESPCYRLRHVDECIGYAELNVHYRDGVCVPGCDQCWAGNISLGNEPPSCYNGTVVSYLSFSLSLSLSLSHVLIIIVFHYFL